MKEDKSYAEKIMMQCLLVQDYLTTIRKSIIADGEDIDGFVDHYSDLIDMAISINWRRVLGKSILTQKPTRENHDAAELISREDFRRNLRIDIDK